MVSNTSCEDSITFNSVASYEFQNHLKNIIKMHGDAKAVVISPTSIPHFGWWEFCSFIESNDDSIFGIASTRHVYGNKIKEFHDISYKNSRLDFYLDVSPFELRVENVDFDSKVIAYYDINQHNNFCTYLTSNGLVALINKITSPSFDLKPDAIFRSIGCDIGRIVYSPSFIVYDI